MTATPQPPNESRAPEHDQTHEHLVVFVTAPNLDDAQTIARRILEAKRAACVSLMPVRSMYWWDGAIQDDSEVLLVIKTHRDAFAALRDTVLAAHSYDTPEIIGLPIVAGSPDYLTWITEEVHAN